MTIPNGDNALRHQLELIVTTELTRAEASQPQEEVEGLPAVDPVPDTDAQRCEADLRTLLDAVEALEDGSRRD